MSQVLPFSSSSSSSSSAAVSLNNTHSYSRVGGFDEQNSTSAVDMLTMLERIEVEAKYIEIQKCQRYVYSDVERWTSEEFADKFNAETSEEAELLADIFMRLKSFSLPESLEMQQQISISDDYAPQLRVTPFNKQRLSYSSSSSSSQSGAFVYQNKSHLADKLNGGDSNIITHSEYQFAAATSNVNGLHRQITMALQPGGVAATGTDKRNGVGGLSGLASRLTETVLFSAKQLPYDPFDFSSVQALTSSLQLPQPQISSSSIGIQLGNTKGGGSVPTVLSIIKQVAEATQKRSAITNSSHALSTKPNIYLRSTFRESPESIIQSACAVLLKSDETGAIRIGRHSDNQIVIQSESASRYHAVVTSTKGHYCIADMGSAQGTFIRVTEKIPHKLIVGSIFKCGSTEFKVVKVTFEEAQAAVQLKVILGNKKNTQLDFTVLIPATETVTTTTITTNQHEESSQHRSRPFASAGTLSTSNQFFNAPGVIGSHSTCSITAVDNQLDKFHARLSYKRGTAIHLSDFQSVSGTWVRLSPGKEKSDLFRLRDGQEILIAQYVITPFIQN